MNKTFPLQGKTVALTGATGFIGPYLVRHLAEHGAHIRALTRRQMPGQDTVVWVHGSLQDKAALIELCTDADAIIHAAGAIKAKSRDDFFTANAHACGHIADAALHCGVHRFLHLSSLAAREAGISDYAASKRAGEDRIAAALSGQIPWICLRPPAVYGPGDTETLKIFKTVKAGFAPLPHPQAKAAWIHVDDLADACIAALEYDAALNGIWEVDDGSGGRALKDCYHLIAGLMGRKVRVVHTPSGLIAFLGTVNEGIAKFTGKTPMLTRKKAREICHPDWAVYGPSLKDVLPWTPQISLEQGFEDTLKWYQERALL